MNHGLQLVPHTDEGPHRNLDVYSIRETWQRSWDIYSSDLARWHRLAFTALLPALFSAIFCLLVGDTLFETYSTQDDLPYSLTNKRTSSFTVNQPSNTSNMSSLINIDMNLNADMETSDSADLATRENSTIGSLAFNDTITKESLSLAREWTEQAPWILADTIIFLLASAVVHAAIVQDTARFYCTHLSLQQLRDEHEEEPLKALRPILWRWRRLGFLFLAALGVAAFWATFLVTIPLWMLWVSSLPSSSATWFQLLVPLVMLPVFVCSLRSMGPSALILLPILAVESFTNLRGALFRAKSLTDSGVQPILVAWFPVAFLCTGLAMVVSYLTVVCVEVLAHSLAAHRNVFLRVDQEEWIFILMIGLLALFFGPAFVSLPFLSIHATVLYINLRAQKESCTEQMLAEDLAATAVVLVLDDDDSGSHDDGRKIRNNQAAKSSLPSPSSDGLEMTARTTGFRCSTHHSASHIKLSPLASVTPMLLLLSFACSTVAKNSSYMSSFPCYIRPVDGDWDFGLSPRIKISHQSRRRWARLDRLHGSVLPPVLWASSSTSTTSGSVGSFYSINGGTPVPAKTQTLLSVWKESVSKQLPPELWAALAGALSFGSTLGLGTTVQRFVGMSTGTAAPFPSLVGLVSVCFASTTAHQVALATHSYSSTGSWPRNFSLWPRRDRSSFLCYDDDVLDLKVIQIPMHSVRIWTMGIACFKLLGGRFWAIAPSSLTHVGSYARASLPATEKYATAAQRLKIERMGRFWGCHTCGSHRFRLGSDVQFVGDHMPPKSVAQRLESSLLYRLMGRKVRFRFYPQCIQCSNKQGSLLSKATADLQARTGRSAARRLAAVGGSRGASYNHGWKPRFNHLTGAILGAIATFYVHPVDLEDENRWRYATWQDDLYRLVAHQDRQDCDSTTSDEPHERDC